MKDRPLTDFDRTVLGQMEQIRAIGRKRLRNQHELDDFVQETIARAYANRSRLRDPAKLKQWIAGVARNTANEWNRAFERMKREQPLSDAIGISDERDPLDALEQAERNEQIRQAMGRLSPADRDLLRGRYLDEESYEALQKRHGLSYSAVGIRLHRAKRRLKKILNGMKIALIIALATLKRNAYGGILFMTKTTKIVLGAAVVLILALFGAYLWLEYGGSPDEAKPGLTLEEQSPRIESLQTKRTAQKETPPPPELEEDASPSEDAAQSGPSDDSGGAENLPAVQLDAPQVEAQDTFTVELQEAADEYIEFGKGLIEAVPRNPGSHSDLKIYSELFPNLMEYNDELRQQGLSREDRIPKLNARLITFGRKLASETHDSWVGFTQEEAQALGQQYRDYSRENAPTKLLALFGVEAEGVLARAPWMQPIP